jgi:hypothetical protein
MEICTSESKVVAFKGNEKNVLNKRNTWIHEEFNYLCCSTVCGFQEDVTITLSRLTRFCGSMKHIIKEVSKSHISNNI